MVLDKMTQYKDNYKILNKYIKHNNIIENRYKDNNIIKEINVSSIEDDSKDVKIKYKKVIQEFKDKYITGNILDIKDNSILSIDNEENIILNIDNEDYSILSIENIVNIVNIEDERKIEGESIDNEESIVSIKNEEESILSMDNEESINIIKDDIKDDIDNEYIIDNIENNIYTIKELKDGIEDRTDNNVKNNKRIKNDRTKNNKNQKENKYKMKTNNNNMFTYIKRLSNKYNNIKRKIEDNNTNANIGNKSISDNIIYISYLSSLKYKINGIEILVRDNTLTVIKINTIENRLNSMDLFIRRIDDIEFDIKDNYLYIQSKQDLNNDNCYDDSYNGVRDNNNGYNNNYITNNINTTTNTTTNIDDSICSFSRENINYKIKIKNINVRDLIIFLNYLKYCNNTLVDDREYMKYVYNMNYNFYEVFKYYNVDYVGLGGVNIHGFEGRIGTNVELFYFYVLNYVLKLYLENNMMDKMYSYNFNGIIIGVLVNNKRESKYYIKYLDTYVNLSYIRNISSVQYDNAGQYDNGKIKNRDFKDVKYSYEVDCKSSMEKIILKYLNSMKIKIVFSSDHLNNILLLNTICNGLSGIKYSREEILDYFTYKYNIIIKDNRWYNKNEDKQILYQEEIKRNKQNKYIGIEYYKNNKINIVGTGISSFMEDKGLPKVSKNKNIEDIYKSINIFKNPRIYDNKYTIFYILHNMFYINIKYIFKRKCNKNRKKVIIDIIMNININDIIKISKESKQGINNSKIDSRIFIKNYIFIIKYYIKKCNTKNIDRKYLENYIYLLFINNYNYNTFIDKYNLFIPKILYSRIKYILRNNINMTLTNPNDTIENIYFYNKIKLYLKAYDELEYNIFQYLLLYNGYNNINNNNIRILVNMLNIYFNLKIFRIRYKERERSYNHMDDVKGMAIDRFSRGKMIKYIFIKTKLIFINEYLNGENNKIQHMLSKLRILYNHYFK